MALDSHYQELGKAEDLLALKDTTGARGLLTKIISKDSTDILARLALAQTYRLEGESNNAVKILEETRASGRRSPALLLELARSYEESGNKTAALDNILLCLKENPKSAVLLERAIELASQMGRLEEAEGHALELLKVCSYSEQQRIQELLAKTKLKRIVKLKESNPEEYRSELQELVKTHKDFEPALVELSDDLFTNNDPNQAVKTLQKALKRGNSFDALSKLVSFWVSKDDPTSAIKLLRETIENSEPKLQIPARTLLTELLLNLENIEEAEKELQILEDLIPVEVPEYNLVEILKAKLESKTPGRGKTNLSLEKLLFTESKRIGFPTLTKVTQNEIKKNTSEPKLIIH